MIIKVARACMLSKSDETLKERQDLCFDVLFKILLFCGGLGVGIIGAFASDVGSTNENSANDYLISKWKQWFEIFDVQHKHQISHKDLEELSENVAAANHLDTDNMQVIETLENLVYENVFYGKPGPIEEEDFVYMHNEHFKENKESYIAHIRNYSTAVINTIFPGLEEITEEQFVDGYKATGHNDVALLKQFFHLYNVVDGKVSLSDIIDSWVEFTTSEDSSKPDIVKAGFDLGI